MNVNLKNKKRIAEPIIDPKDMERVRSNISNKARNLLLFDLATQTGIRMKDLLRLKVKHLTGMRKGENFSIRTDQGKKYTITITETIFETFHKYIGEVGPNMNDYLFKSGKGQQPLALSSASNMISGWFEAANINNCYGAISLRKTWDYTIKKEALTSKDIMTPKHDSIFQPIKTTTTQSKIYKELFKAITSRKLPPGFKLNAREIAKQFNVSQAPVRVALSKLEARGFIISRNKSIIVKKLTPKELKEILQARLVLESAAAKLACKSCSQETLSMLESIIQQYEKATSFEERDQLNTRFHTTLYRDADIPLFTNLIYDLCNRLSPYIIIEHEKTDLPMKFQDLVNSYKEIIEGMRRKNLDQVLASLKERINLAEKILMRLLDGK